MFQFPAFASYPYVFRIRYLVTIPRKIRDSSRAGHVKSCLNMGGPSSKPKYSYMTDSEPVP